MRVDKELEDYDAIRSDYAKFKQLFPQSDLTKEADKLLESIPDEYQALEE
ncbi:MAG: hypothetical protein P8X42_13150 [Calditrichaceae bacterium]